MIRLRARTLAQTPPLASRAVPSTYGLVGLGGCFRGDCITLARIILLREPIDD